MPVNHSGHNLPFLIALAPIKENINANQPVCIAKRFAFLCERVINLVQSSSFLLKSKINSL